jgi:NAD(P)H-quinone oxidoreductase subunit 5
MRLMGGLRKFMPITALTFLIGTLAISGLPPFAGFWSKDEILGAVFAANPLMWAIGWLTAGVTAFYMFRMYFSTFEGEFRGNDGALKRMVKRQSLQMAGASLGPGAMSTQEFAIGEADHGSHHHAEKPHESALSMTLPLLLLAVPSAVIGLVGTPFANYFEAFIHPSGEALTVAELAEEFDMGEFVQMAGASVAISIAGIVLAVLMYRTKAIDAGAIAQKIQPLYNLSLNKWYIDDLYREVFIKGTRNLAKGVLNVDVKIVDGIVNLTGFVTLITGEGLKYFENGRAQFYALIVFGAVLGLVFVSGLGWV